MSQRLSLGLAFAAFSVVSCGRGGQPASPSPTTPAGPAATTVVTVVGPTTPLNFADRATLTATLSRPGDAKTDCTQEADWRSSDETSVKTLGRGLIQVVGPGPAVVTATCSDVSGTFQPQIIIDFTYVIQGVVTDVDTGVAVAGATLRLASGAPGSTVTDGNGAFQLSVPWARDLSVDATHPAYAPARLAVTGSLDRVITVPVVLRAVADPVLLGPKQGSLCDLFAHGTGPATCEQKGVTARSAAFSFQVRTAGLLQIEYLHRDYDYEEYFRTSLTANGTPVPVSVQRSESRTVKPAPSWFAPLLAPNWPAYLTVFTAAVTTPGDYVVTLTAELRSPPYTPYQVRVLLKR